ncbi:MAG TPA: hypothetical protein VGX68_14580 [Thermoanaerobaculia bacterium]|jgi:hypothetical protein|nr:hypothetical protein [Thermoanaerobaculia bacterium]
MESVAQTAVARSRVERAAALPWYLSAMLAGSTSIVIGLLWDISWHMTIGRDTFWTPAHLAIHFGGVLAGLSCAWLALKTTFAGTEAERAAAVRFWGFRAPFGAWVTIWGALAMLTSAPFDDWWHNAYGLDVEILSPPHSVLAAGMIAIQLGGMLLALALQNRAPAGEERTLGLAHVYAAGIVLLMVATLLTEYSYPNHQHGGLFYEVACGAFPVLLVAVARSSRLRWAATLTCAFYMLIACAMVWILPLFPARPMLGPINTPLDHMVPPLFPLLLIVPAAALDWLLQRRPGKRAGWLDALLIGAAFFALLLVVHWYFSKFQLSPASRNAFFAGDRQWDYSSNPGPWRYQFWDREEDPMTLKALGAALLLAVGSTRIGLWWGQWMAKVKR